MIYILEFFTKGQQFKLTLGKTVAPSLVLVIVGCCRTPELLIKTHTVVHKSVFVKKRKLACCSSAISSVSTQTTRSRALLAHVRGINDTFTVSRPLAATVVTIHAVCDVTVCLAMSPFLIFVIVTGCCTPRLVVFTVLEGTFRVFHTIVNEREDAGCVIVVP